MHLDVLIVGGGVIGASTAFHLAEQGARVVIIERGRAGGHASLASAGLLHPLTDPSVPEPLRALSAASFALFPDLVERLRAIAGIDPQFAVPGWLRVALDEPDAAAMWAERRTVDETPYDIRVIDGDEARAIEPALSPHVGAALHLPRGAQVYVPALLAAYLHAAARLGAVVRNGVEAVALCLDGRRVIGARTAEGEEIHAGHTLLAGGAWTPHLATTLGITLPIYPIRGQILAFHGVPAPLRRVVFSPGAYLAPKADGSVLVGATYEDVGFDDRLTAGGLAGLLQGALRVAPVLADATFRQAWVGLRPGSRDGLPFLGAIPNWEGVSIAAGHEAEGVLLSPITGALMAEHILGQPTPLPLAPFGLTRLG